jgi:SAM-dependent MidA family methyltransferase
MPFSRYMELCLYDPLQGYYSRHSDQFGKAGDFYTASDIHAVYGRLLARQFAEMWRALDCPRQLEILELGPGRGLFARDVLDWSQKKFPEFFESLTYTLQESSPALRAKLAENLAPHFSRGKAALSQPGNTSTQPGNASVEMRPAALPRAADDSVETRLAASRPAEDPPALTQQYKIHRSCPPQTPLIVFASEFFDALPVEILSAQGKVHLGYQDRNSQITAYEGDDDRVRGYDGSDYEGSRLTEIWLPPSATELEFLDRNSVHPEPGERLEVPLAAQHWAAAISPSIVRGFLVLIDYGYTRGEQLAGRHRGTLMAYRQHSASPDPYEAPGEQDLTAHVNFTALAGAIDEAGLCRQKLLTQSQFLMGIGEPNQFADVFEDCIVPQEKAKVALQLKHLISPTGMGETFHVLVASRGVEPHKLTTLSGLRFA